MPSNGQQYVWNDLVGRLIGSRLYSVQFVLDYVQLRFDGSRDDDPFLNCDVMPVVETGERRIVPGQPGYADALVSLIPGVVIATAEAGRQGLRLELTTGAVVLLPTPDELVGPEIALLSGFA